MASKGRFAEQTRVVLAGSEKQPFQPAVVETLMAVESKAPAAPPPGLVTVSVIVRPKQTLDGAALARGEGRLSRAEFARRHGPDPASLRLVKAFAKEFGLTVAAGAGPRTLLLSGSAAAMQTAFAVTLTQQTAGGKKYRTREGAIELPEELSGHVLAVLGLDNRPQAQPHFRVRPAAAAGTSYTPVQVAELYGLAQGASAAGQTIGLIELGGGFRKTDLTAYFKTLGQKAPTVTAVLVDKGKNAPTTASGADGEVMLDIEVCGAVAQGAKVAVYFAPNTDQGFIDAIATAVHDTTHKPSVISISWGGPESTWTAQATSALDAACQSAAALGITITVASGDNGSSDGVAGTANHVDFPASSPHVLACGGTKLITSGTAITSEVVWNETAANEGATGGGVSTVFPLPAWQDGAGVPAATDAAGGRGVPDVAGDADPETGYEVRVDGQTLVIGGTSAVAPLWAGLIAVANAGSKTTAGFINPLLYASKGVARDITTGNNGAFAAKAGWDACTGLGSPDVAGLLAALGAAKTKKSPVSEK